MNGPIDAWWAKDAAALLRDTSSPQGLTPDEAARRLAREGRNVPRASHTTPAWRKLVHELASPLVLLLLGAALVSALAREWVDATIVVAIVVAGAVLGAVQERRANHAVEQLRSRVGLSCEVIRGGKPLTIPTDEVVRGDIVALRAGSLVPADGVVLEARDFFVAQAALTGETFPVEKEAGVVAVDAALAARTNAVFLGTNVRSGTARMLVCTTGPATVFGHVAERLGDDPPETDFDRGIREFGILLTQTVLLLVLVVFAVNVLLARPAVESLLFAVALAVGIAPELLPAIVLVNLSKGATEMAKAGVIVRRLSAIEDFGSMQILCTDKTATLTEGIVRLESAVDAAGAPSPTVLSTAAANARLQSGPPNPLDTALDAAAPPTTLEKIDEIPYDFRRKRISVVVRGPDGPLMITKGAVDTVLPLCTLDDGAREAARQRVEGWYAEGFRVLALGTRKLDERPRYAKTEEADLELVGFLLFLDPPKAGVGDAIAALAHLGVELKVISGDHHLVVAHLAQSVGLPVNGMLTGKELDQLSEDAIGRVALTTTLFAEVDPDQKERIVRSLRRAGYVIGYMGDGINDAPAMHAAHVGISVEGAVDVAREAADFVLLEQDLDVLRRGVIEGRTTFANTLKYVNMTESANLGNMLSMAAASAFLPFLPMLAKQVLLNNFLSDFPGMAIATDDVDDEMIAKPHRWDIRAVRRYMIGFGLVSAVFDGVTFVVLIVGLGAADVTFRTGWFVESLWTELAVVMVLRTNRPFWKSRPSVPLAMSSIAVAVVGLALPYSPLAPWLGFEPMAASLVVALVVITATYVAVVEVTKRWLMPATPLVTPLRR